MRDYVRVINLCIIIIIIIIIVIIIIIRTHLSDQVIVIAILLDTCYVEKVTESSNKYRPPECTLIFRIYFKQK